jgi:hypothetical protein
MNVRSSGQWTVSGGAGAGVDDRPKYEARATEQEKIDQYHHQLLHPVGVNMCLVGGCQQIIFEWQCYKIITDCHFFKLQMQQLDSDAEYKTLLKQKDDAYAERNKCVALLARMAIATGLKAGLGKHDEKDESWDDDWRNIVFVELPSGQVSWHIQETELPMFSFLPVYSGTWDGHTTSEKYQRVLDARFS